MADQLIEALKFVVTKIFGFNINLISNHMSGGRAFNMLAAGADVTANEFCHNGIGCGAISAKAATEIRNEQAELRRITYENQPFMKRLFDRESEYSPLVKLAMAMPSNPTSAVRNVIAKLSNPLKLMSDIFGSLFVLPSVGAQIPTETIDDPFGIIQYGYPKKDPSFDIDADEYWRSCVANSLTQKWNEEGAAGASLENAYQPVNTKPNRCLLIQTAAGASGALFTDEVLNQDEINNTPPAYDGSTASSGSGGSSPSPSPTPPTPPPGPPQCGPTNTDPICAE